MLIFLFFLVISTFIVWSWRCPDHRVVLFCFPRFDPSQLTLINRTLFLSFHLNIHFACMAIFYAWSLFNLLCNYHHLQPHYPSSSSSPYQELHTYAQLLLGQKRYNELASVQEPYTYMHCCLKLMIVMPSLALTLPSTWQHNHDLKLT